MFYAVKNLNTYSSDNPNAKEHAPRSWLTNTRESKYENILYFTMQFKFWLQNLYAN